MKYLIVLFLLTTSLFSAEVLKKENIGGRDISLIKFNNHTYIYFQNHWNYAGDALFHDPDCEYCRNKIVDAINKIREE
jgi:hypothetical protein